MLVRSWEKFVMGMRFTEVDIIYLSDASHWLFVYCSF